jgi:hypothetical protein
VGSAYHLAGPSGSPDGGEEFWPLPPSAACSRSTAVETCWVDALHLVATTAEFSSSSEATPTFSMMLPTVVSKLSASVLQLSAASRCHCALLFLAFGGLAFDLGAANLLILFINKQQLQSG